MMRLRVGALADVARPPALFVAGLLLLRVDEEAALGAQSVGRGELGLASQRPDAGLVKDALLSVDPQRSALGGERLCEPPARRGIRAPDQSRGIDQPPLLLAREFGEERAVLDDGFEKGGSVQELLDHAALGRVGFGRLACSGRPIYGLHRARLVDPGDMGELAVRAARLSLRPALGCVSTAAAPRARARREAPRSSTMDSRRAVASKSRSTRVRSVESDSDASPAPAGRSTGCIGLG